MSLTASGLEQIYSDIKKVFPDFELATGLCNQDSLEHANSKMRGRNGYNSNPTCRMLRLTFRHIVSTDFIETSDRGNVKLDETHSLLNSSKNVAEKIPLESSKSNDESTLNNDNTSDVFELPELPEYTDTELNEIQELMECANMMQSFDDMDSTDFVDFHDKDLYEKNSITFFSGCVSRKICKRNKCNECKETFIKSSEKEVTENELYIQHREFPHLNKKLPSISYLTRATDHFVEIVTLQLQVFQKHYKNLWHQRKLLASLMEIAETYTNSKFPTWFDKSNNCYIHRKDALKLLFLIKIYKVTNENNCTRKFSTAKTVVTDNPKLKKLKNM